MIAAVLLDAAPHIPAFVRNDQAGDTRGAIPKWGYVALVLDC